MFRLFPRSDSAPPSASRLLPGGWDAHAHILPGVDDGAACMDDALAIIRSLRKLGLRGAVCTPHVMARYPGNTPAALAARFRQLRQAAAQACPGFGLALAAEYMVDDLLPGLLARPASLLTHPGPAPEAGAQASPCLLLELPQYLLPPAWADSLLAPLALGLTPLLAHPERYCRVLSEDDIASLRSQGVLLQGDLGSLSGLYGPDARRLARRLLKRGLYSCWGTDAHSPDMLRAINIAP